MAKIHLKRLSKFWGVLQLSLRSLERRLSELKKSGKIKSKRGGKERGYFIV